MKVKIIKNEQVALHAYKMTLAAPGIARAAKPGQFVMARIADSYQPLLRRPFGVHDVFKGNVDILYEIIGEGTNILSQKKSGETLDIIGPLGNGFNLNANILIAGGMGVAPLLFLAKKLKKSTVLIGAKTKSHILCEKEFKKLGCDVKIATDDGSKGYKGFVTDLLQDQYWGHPAGTARKNTKVSPQSVPIASAVLCACGPKPMLKAVAKKAREYNAVAQVSLEEYMACGIGACLGCIVDTKQGQKRVCKDGPVFDAKEIIW